MSLEIGRPLQIDDDDCDVSEPTPVDDDHIRPTGIVMPPREQIAPNGLVAVIPVVRITAQLKKTLKSRTIAQQTLDTYDSHFVSIMASYPEPFPINSQAYLDPRLLTAACHLQTVRFFLNRHNLSPVCRLDERLKALDRCVAAAEDTAHYVRRSMQQQSSGSSSGPGYHSPSHMASWAARLRTMAPAFWCNHLWRCMLVLCLRLDFLPALTLVQASAAIGELRKNNMACGRNLAFFLGKLIGRLQAGATQQTLQTDEEMLAYASGDMQGGADEAWTWSGGDAGSFGNATTHTMTTTNGYASDRTTPSAAGSHADPSFHQQQVTPSCLTQQELDGWGGWEYIQRTLEHLLHQQQQQHNLPPPPPPPAVQQQQAPPPAYLASAGPPPHHTPPTSYAHQPPSTTYSPLPGTHYTTASTSSTAALQAPTSSIANQSTSPPPSNGGGSSRISIKDII